MQKTVFVGNANLHRNSKENHTMTIIWKVWKILAIMLENMFEVKYNAQNDVHTKALPTHDYRISSLVFGQWC